MDVFITPFSSNSFMLQALVAGMLVSIACAIAGTFVILRGLAFIGDALAHGVLPGIALAILLGFPGIIGAAVGSVVMIGGVTLITQRSRLSSDTAIGLLFVGMLSLGVVIVSRSNSFSGDLTRILFGEILGIGIPSIMVQLVATVIIGVIAAAVALVPELDEPGLQLLVFLFAQIALLQQQLKLLEPRFDRLLGEEHFRV